ncbi:MAG: efflux RND transporter periplasmic adaptor subunit [Stagnimonas sp.]|nr:efflux RND transporter periplasmic adaptor subunit [Stagnimonas sp.]
MKFLRLAPLLLCLLAACSAPESTAPGNGNGGEKKPAAAPVPVRTAPVGTAELARALNAVGSLASDESVTIAAEIAGRVVRIGFREGQPVAQGSTLFELDDSLDRATVAQAQANLRLSERNDRRAGEIAARGLIAASDRDEVAAKLAVDQAGLQLAQARLAKMRIVAPLAGVTGLRTVGVGDYVSPGQQLVNLEVLNPMKLDFRLPESALPVLKPGLELEVEVDAWPGERFAGEVYAIDPRIADSSRSIAVRARLDNRDGRLKPGLFARVRLKTALSQPALVVPEQAIFPQGEQLFVYVIEDGKAVLRGIKLGQREPGRAEVIEGLKAGEELVVSGLQKLSPGATVIVQATPAEAGESSSTP